MKILIVLIVVQLSTLHALSQNSSNSLTGIQISNIESILDSSFSDSILLVYDNQFWAENQTALFPLTMHDLLLIPMLMKNNDFTTLKIVVWFANKREEKLFRKRTDEISNLLSGNENIVVELFHRWDEFKKHRSNESREYQVELLCNP